MALPGGEIELELATEVVGNADSVRTEGAAGAHALWVNPTVWVPAAEPRPNVVLVVVDDLRADHLGCYGYGRDTSPFLDSLASGGALFQEAHSQATATLPSHRGLLTSTHQLLSALRHTTEGKTSLRQPLTMPISLQGQLRKAGYKTLGCVGGGYLDPTFGFDADFDWYWSPADVVRLPDQISAVKQRLQSTSPEPFFLFLHTYEVHHYRKGWGHGLGRFDRGYAGRLTDTHQLTEALYEDPAGLSAADLQYLRDLYDGEIRCTDEQLQSFLGWLLKQPWAQHTIIVITADHGEAFGEHGEMRHGGAPYREVVRVPLILYRSDGRWRGSHIDQPVSLVDLAPTLLELAGLSPPSEMVGGTLAPLLDGQQSRSRPIFCASRPAVMARHGPLWYLSWRRERPEELYDIARDPGQQHNIAASSPRDLSRMRSVLATLTMQAASGYRLVAAGPRQGTLTIEMESSSVFSYCDVPTLRRRDAIEIQPATLGEGREGGAPAGQRIRVRLAAGDEPHVILFEPANRQATISVTARLGPTPVEATRFHLGKSGACPAASPLVIGSAARVALASDRPPVPSSPETWGLWLWLPAAAAEAEGPALSEAEGSRGLTPEKLPESVEKQLRSLGYLR